MTYATRADLKKRYGVDEIVQREAAIDTGGLDLILDSTDALVNGYLAGRYALPLTAIPPNLPQVACAIARYELLGEAASERARNDYKDAISWLKDVQAGRVLLQSAATEPDAAPSAVVTMTTSAAVFKRAGRP